MAVTTLRSGNSGRNVKDLQQALIDAGYNVGATGADGIYGKNTTAAVKQYQKDNGLAVDGIAGKNTLGSLYGTSTTTSGSTSNAKAAASTPTTQKKSSTSTSTKTSTTSTEKETKTPDTGFVYEDFSYKDYAPSDVVNQANALLQQHNAAKPGAYQSQWEDEIADYLNQIQNRDPFSYDFNSDALYQQYKDNYIQQGQMAMMDTMGQAAAMTGGYGNSYAQNVGQQAYHQYLNQLNNIIPELYQMAHDRYAYEGQQLKDMYNMYLGLENQDYSRYQSDLDNWYTQLDYLTDNYNTERELDYQKYQQGRLEARDEYTSDKDLAWKEYLEQKEKEEAAASLMASAGNYDRLGDLYGLSANEIAAIKAANTPVATSGGGGLGSTAKKYKDIDVGSTAYNSMMSEIRKAGGINDLVDITNKYLSLGYDPDQINGLTAGAAAALAAGNGGTGTEVTPIGGGLPQEEKDKRKNSGARTGLGTIYQTTM